MTTFYIVYAIGNYSGDFGWDGGCRNIAYIDDLSITDATSSSIELCQRIGADRDIHYRIEFRKLTDYGRAFIEECAEYAGSRYAKVIVLADNKTEAERRALEVLDKKFPPKG